MLQNVIAKAMTSTPDAVSGATISHLGKRGGNFVAQAFDVRRERACAKSERRGLSPAPLNSRVRFCEAGCPLGSGRYDYLLIGSLHRGGRRVDRVAVHDDFDTAVALAAFGSVIRRDRFGLAEALGRDGVVFQALAD